jgi:antitoxin component of MazEF toxin-antitoxin module
MAAPTPTHEDFDCNLSHVYTLSMPLVKTLFVSGGSKAVTLPKAFLDQLGITDDEAEVAITLEGDRIVITRHRYASDAEFTRAADRVLTRRRRALAKLAK